MPLPRPAALLKGSSPFVPPGPSRRVTLGPARFLRILLPHLVLLASGIAIASDGSWWLPRGYDPSGRYRLLSVLIILNDQLPVTSYVCRRLEARTGERTHLTHGSLAERPTWVTVAPSSPVRP
jgi:hypothetical protein